MGVEMEKVEDARTLEPPRLCLPLSCSSVHTNTTDSHNFCNNVFYAFPQYIICDSLSLANDAPTCVAGLRWHTVCGKRLSERNASTCIPRAKRAQR